jgi:AmiR/NasT family two-component response regulator
VATFIPPEPGRHTSLDECQEEVDDLRKALATRPVIDQAKGVLMGRHGCTPDEAFEMLTDASQRANVNVRDIAARIMFSVQDGADDPSGPST